MIQIDGVRMIISSEPEDTDRMWRRHHDLSSDVALSSRFRGSLATERRRINLPNDRGKMSFPTRLRKERPFR